VRNTVHQHKNGEKEREMRIEGLFLAVIVLAGLMFAAARMPVGKAASQIAINNAIEKGLAYLALNTTQASDGSWGSSSPVASTAMAVLAFENAPNNHFGWNLTDPYHATVQKGLDYLFTQAHVQVLSNKTVGSPPQSVSPDTNGNGIGIDFYSYNYGYPHYTDECYQTPMVLMAIVASENENQTATTGPANVTGRSYFDIATDIVDWIAWAQNDATTGAARGGWRYTANFGSSDNSVSQWPVLGLLLANQTWKIRAPSWVGSELNLWIRTDQDLTGNNNTNSNYGSFGYAGADNILGGVLETAAGILELSYIGVPTGNSSIIAAEGYINKMWNYYDGSWGVNIGNLYGMYAVMKAMRETNPLPTIFIANYDGSHGVEWYNGTGEYADTLIANQNPDGSWVNWKNWAETPDISLTTAFGVLILEYVVINNKGNLEVTVVNSATNSTISGSNVTITGPDPRSPLEDITGSYGNLTFSNVTFGGYTVTASMLGYYPNSTSGITVYPNETTDCIISLTPIPSPHDVAVTDVSPVSDWVYQGILCHCTINVTVTNKGSFAEDFLVSVFAYNDSSGNYTVGTQSVTGLQPGNTLTLTFLWNTTGVPVCHLYNITSVASLGDDATPADNILSSSTLVYVRIIGDINGDGKVNLVDLTLMAASYGSYLGSPRWNEACDIDNNGRVNLVDLVTLAVYYGQHSP
jgi:hypothetical protein